MPSRVPPWRGLVPGIIALAAVVGVAFGILRYMRIGALRGDTYRVYMHSNEARGILENSDVWLGGKRVGKVDKIEFRPVESDTLERVRLTLKILERYRELVRADAYGQIRSGGSLLGEPVVYITFGTQGAPILAEEALLDSRPQADAENVASEIARASREFPEIIANAKRIKDSFTSLSSTLGGTTAEEPVTRLRLVGRRAQRLTASLSDTGTVGRMLADSAAIRARLTRIMARSDSLMDQVQRGGGTLALARGDSTLLRELANVQAEVSIVRALIQESRGTAGRMLYDEAVPRALADVERELGTLIRDLKANPFRYIIH